MNIDLTEDEFLLIVTALNDNYEAFTSPEYVHEPESQKIADSYEMLLKKLLGD